MYAPLSRNVFWIYGPLQIKIIILLTSNFYSGFLQEKRNTFDIHKYGTSVLERLTESEATQSDPWVPFSKVVETEPQYEVCRMLLASLQLVSLLRDRLRFSWLVVFQLRGHLI